MAWSIWKLTCRRILTTKGLDIGAALEGLVLETEPPNCIFLMEDS